ncbi:MAG: GNAT family N-acetyltransferase, partial [Actinobacteria bacterium]|nr:GNAT family N-acetyltransferase [Actinomycetota bacterium]
EQLVRGILALKDDAGVSRLDIHGRAVAPELRLDARAVTHSLELPGSPEEVRSLLTAATRRAVTRARRENVTYRLSRERRDLTETFYALHLVTRQRQGVPIQPRRFFDLFWEKIIAPGNGYVMVGEVEGEPVAAMVMMHWQRTVHYKFGASNDVGRRVGANFQLMLGAIEESCRAGFAHFDFGRSDLPNDGLRRYKSSFGAEEVPLLYSTTSLELEEVGSGRVGAMLAFGIKRTPPWVCRLTGEALYRFVA